LSGCCTNRRVFFCFIIISEKLNFAKIWICLVVAARSSVQIVLFGQFFVNIRLNDKYLFSVGLFWGYSKPDDSNDFLQDFCAELNILLTDRIILKKSFGILFKKKDLKV